MDLRNKKIAIVGVSDNTEKFGYKIFSDLIKSNYEVYGINPRGGMVLERKIYKSLSELEIKPDIVITVVPPQITEKVVDECIQLGIKELWMQPGSESQEAIKKATESGLKTTANACIMVKSGIW